MEVIQSVEKVRNKVRITFESGWQVWFLNRQVLPFPLREGTEVDHESLEKTVLLSQYPSALDKAVAMLAQRSHSKGEIERKLKTANYDQEVIELVLYKPEKEKLLDDRDFAVQWVESRIRKYGAARIRQELRMKNVDPEVIDEALQAASEEEQLQRAVDFIRKKANASRASGDPQKFFRNTVAALVRRGYFWETARKAFQIVSGDHSGDR